MKSGRKRSLLCIGAFVLANHPSTSRGFLSFSRTARCKPNAPKSRKSPLQKQWQHPSLLRVLKSLDEHSLQTDDAKGPAEILWSYVYNLQVARKTGDKRPARSLAHFLKQNPLPTLSVSEAKEVAKACERALTQALRAAGATGDYRLILQLVNESIHFANGQSILTPRIFGEAMDAMSQTGANASKLKYIWSLLVATPSASSCLAHSPTAFELNVLLKSLASRGKTRACIDLYQQHTCKDTDQVFIRPDAYSATTLFSTLTDSIVSDQQPVAPVRFKTAKQSSSLQAELRKLSHSPCWQWNTAVELLSTLRGDEFQWNNFAYSSLLKLQNRAMEVFPRHGNGLRIAVTILNHLMQQKVVPDVVTYTLVLQAMGDSASQDPDAWKVALRLLNQMKRRARDKILPFPNVYCYTAAIVACAKCNRCNEALSLLEEMRTNPSASGKGGGPDEIESADTMRPNTWTYNAVILAICNNPATHATTNKNGDVKTRNSIGDLDRQSIVLKLLAQMEKDHEDYGMDSLPDSVTYNTVLAALRTNLHESIDNCEQVLAIIDEMKSRGVPRDVTTYRNAIQAAPNGASVKLTLQACVDDASMLHHSDSNHKRIMTTLFNSALSVLAALKNIGVFQDVLRQMQENGTPLDRETTNHMIMVLSTSGKSKHIIPLLRLLAGDENDGLTSKHLEDSLGITFNLEAPPPYDETHYDYAISLFLRENDMKRAQEVVSMMRDNGLSPTATCTENFAMAYAKEAASTASRKQRVTRSLDFAQRAHILAMSLEEPSFMVLSKTSLACAATRQWERTLAAMHRIHEFYLDPSSMRYPIRRKEEEKLTFLHSSLLRECAIAGNVTAALWFASDIQRFSKRLSESPDASSGVDPKAGASRFSERNIVKELYSYDLPGSRLGMRAEDWVSLVRAASASGHWRVCVNSMQFLRPHVEATKNTFGMNENEAVLRNNRYELLAQALSATTRCLEKRSQYAWSLRIVEEWMEWSGRKPRPEAVLATLRGLAARGRGEETKNLLLKCMDKTPLKEYSRKGMNYEELLYIGAVTSLHNNGLYDDADEVFIAGIKQGAIPLDIDRNDDDELYVLDLHGLNVAMAHSAVRVAMRQQMSANDASSAYNMVIITGRGRNSRLTMRPVLRPEVQRMLLEEFYPPLNTVSVPGNMGALLVSAEDISAWQVHQEEQKGARLLTLAAVLRDFSQNRLRKSIAKSLKASSGSEDEEERPTTDDVA